MIREIVKPKTQDFVIHLPDEYIDQEIEILVFPIKEKKTSITNKLSGILKNSNLNEKDYKEYLEEKYL